MQLSEKIDLGNIVIISEHLNRLKSRDLDKEGLLAGLTIINGPKEVKRLHLIKQIEPIIDAYNYCLL